MNSYFLIFMADVFLAGNFVCQKNYQSNAGTSVKAGLVYNAFSGLISALMLLCINKFEINITVFSLSIAFCFAIVIMLYIFIGFRIMNKGSMSLYTLFLMSGGMVVPYIWGVLFLHEDIGLMRIIGIIAIISAIVSANYEKGQTGTKNILPFVAVFFLNGIASILSKTHQISSASEFVSSSDFAFLAMSLKSVIGFAALLLMKNRLNSDSHETVSIKPIALIITIAAVADGLSFVLQLIGARNLPATVLYPMIAGGSVVLTSIAGVIMFKEKLSAKRWLGVIVCFIGTLLFL